MKAIYNRMKTLEEQIVAGKGIEFFMVRRSVDPESMDPEVTARLVRMSYLPGSLEEFKEIFKSADAAMASIPAFWDDDSIGRQDRL